MPVLVIVVSNGWERVTLWEVDSVTRRQPCWAHELRKIIDTVLVDAENLIDYIEEMVVRRTTEATEAKSKDDLMYWT